MNKPLLRGHIHQESFFVALGACAMLVAKSTNSNSLVASVVYSVCLVMLFGISAAYHRPNWSARARAVMRRIDHSAIFVLIGGCFTPVCLLAMPEEIGFKLLKIVYAAVLFGVLKCVFWSHAPKWFSSLTYIIVGALFVPFMPELYASLGANNMALIIGGGIIYIIGAVFYTFKKPNFFPEVFGHHELFHVCVVIGAICHFIVMYQLIT